MQHRNALAALPAALLAPLLAPLLVLLLGQAPLPAQAHDGHDNAPAAAPAQAAPRFALDSELFELVGVVNGHTLALYLDRADDNRPVPGVQLAAAEGSAKNWDFGAMGGLLGSGFGGVGGGYSNTAEGKVIVAAFLDSYSGIVKAVQNYKAQNVKGGLGTGGNLAVQGGETGGQTMTLREAQARLNELGFDVGSPDGRMGAKTRSQLSKFQQSRRIPVTGVLDQATSDELSR